MNPPIGLLTPVKAALGRWLSQFHAQYQGDTPATVEWSQRQSHQAMAFAPGRMVDQVQDMLSAWKRNDNGGSTTSAFLPVLFIAVAPDYTETPGEHGRPLTDWLPFSFPDDTLNRSFRVRLVHGDLRAQVVVVSPDALSTMSIILQLVHWGSERQTFYAPFEFAGFTTHWPVKLLQAERMAITTPLGEQMSVLSLDLTLRISLPRFKSADREEVNDGHEPPGFPVVEAVENGHDMSLGPPTGVTAEEWAAFARRVRWADGPAQVGLNALKAEA